MKTTILKQKRKEKGLSQVEVVERTKIPIRSYQRYETGERIPNAYTAQLIAQALNTTVEELFPLSQRNNSDTDSSKE